MIKDNNYIVIQGWMRDLGLSGNKLMVFAIIYGFSQDENSMYSGTASYIADWLGVRKHTVLDILKELTANGLLEKVEKNVNGVKLCDYRIPTQVVRKSTEGGAKIAPGGGAKTAPHNTSIDNTRENTPLIIPPKGENEMQHFISLWNKLADVFSEKYPYNKPIARIKSSTEVPNFAVRKKELTKLVKDLLANDEDGSMAESLAKRDNDIWRWAFQQLWIRITKSSFLRGEDKVGENYSEPFRLTPARFMSKKCFIKWVSPND